jgi:NAD(P)-dependent dehydrogenase (short-subunit alcohol dehydrogenase family)
MSQEHLDHLFDLDGRVAVVVGADETGGRELSCGLGRLGAVVVVAGESMHHGHRTVELIRAFGGEAGFFGVDATSVDSLELLIDYSLGEHGRVDVVFMVSKHLLDKSGLAELQWQVRLVEQMTRRQENEVSFVAICRHEVPWASFDAAFAELVNSVGGDSRLWINAVVIADTTAANIQGLVSSTIHLAAANTSHVQGSVIWLG